MIHLQQDVFNDSRLAMPMAENSTMVATWSAVLEERRRLAREIHDTLAQAFIGILVHLESVPETVAAVGKPGSDPAKRLAHAKHLAKCGLEDSRRMLLGLRPKDLDGTSLAGGLKALADRHALEWGIACKFRAIGNEANLPTDVQAELYRVAQEALCNVRKHSRATLVSIFLNWGADTISLTISDNGQGFLARRPKAAMEGFGLSSMRERALRIGGTIDICSTPRRGTEVRLKMPSRRD